MVINDFLIGADPEFIMADHGKLHMMSEDDEFQIAAGEVGPDHGGCVAELRPKPALGTYAVVKRMQKLLTVSDWGDHIDAKWLAGPIQRVQTTNGGCYCDACRTENGEEDETEELVQPLGGHIHLDIRANNPAWDSVVDALDAQYKFLERLELFPLADIEARREEGYGKYRWVTCNNVEEDCRYEKTELDDGRGNYPAEEYHMEYRTPPSWLYHPRLAMLCLTSAKLAAADPQGTIEILNNQPAQLNTLRNWYDRYKTKDANASRVADNILKGRRLSQLQFDTKKDLKDTWQTLDF